jgi:hypothetical protein
MQLSALPAGLSILYSLRNPTIMKTLRYFLFPLLLLAAGNSHAQTKAWYESQWRRVDTLTYTKGRPQAALLLVDSLYSTARRQGNNAELLHALLYRGRLRQENREDNEVQSIYALEKEVKTLTGTAKALAQSMLAGYYQQYLSRNMWNLYNRKPVADTSADISTWAPARLQARIMQLYRASLQPAKLLQGTDLTAYETLIVPGNVRNLRPTLYDLLAHAALDYYNSGQYELQQPENNFQITQPEAFAEAALFTRTRFRNTDTASLQAEALRLFQELTRLHLRSGNRAALEDIDLERLRYVQYKYGVQERDRLYVQALRTRINNEHGIINMGARLLLANWYHGQGSGYDPLRDTTQRWANREALSLLAPAIKDTSRGTTEWNRSYNLAQEILRPLIRLQVEKVNVPGQPFRLLAEYRNVGQLYFRIIPITHAWRLNGEDEDDWDSLYHLKPAQQWTVSLPVTGDAQLHRAELKADALPTGTYMLCASTTADFVADSTTLAGALFYVSNIAFIHNGERIRIVDRETGAALPGARVEVYPFRENYNNYYDYDLLPQSNATYTADGQGFVQPPLGGSWDLRYALKISSGKDSLFQSAAQDRFYWSRYDRGYGYNDPSVFFFTDRSIYRPGQIVYFKGIVVNRTPPAKLVSGLTATVILLDVNGQNKGKIEVTSSEWGSFDGRFTLPEGVLGGRFSIMMPDAYGSTQFSVEEYKRPKFEVRFDTLKATYKAGDRILLHGLAKAYAGNTISNGKARYRVTRRLRRPWWWYEWSSGTGVQEITHGETTTTADGSFDISFIATADTHVSPQTNPFWEFQVSVDVTDINGETRSGTMSVVAGYRSLQLQFTGPGKLPADSFSTIPLSLTNTAGQAQRLPVKAVISRLRTPSRLLRDRLWERPDQHVIDSSEFVRLFPHDPYSDETELRQWPVEREALQFTDTLRSGQLQLPTGKHLEPGFYELTVSAMAPDGEETIERRRIELYRPGKPTAPTYLAVEAAQTSIEPGEELHVNLLTSSKLEVLSSLQRPTDSLAGGQLETFRLDGQKQFSIPASESDRGGMRIAYYAVRDNRVHQTLLPVNVPWTNKQLRISTGTFRDKALPGSEQKWSVQISGLRGEQVAAEMLASMYDASLDQLLEHSWRPPALWPSRYYDHQWTGDVNFRSGRSENLQAELHTRVDIPKTYDMLLFSPIAEEGKRIRLRGVASPNGPMNEVVVTAMAQNRNKDVGYSTAEVLAGKIAGVTIAGDSASDAKEPAQQPVTARRAFQETAVFLPALHTDKDGNISFSFTLPESLTRWKMQTLAHTKDLAFGYRKEKMVTQKDLMVQPNLPRFLRQGDHLEISTKVVNLSGKELTGQVQLELFDAATGTPVDGWFQNFFPNQYFTVAPGGSEAVAFPVEVPYLYNSALTWRITARSGNFSDAEENTLPILSNRILVTETMPLPMRGAGTKTFTLEKLLRSGSSETMQQQGYTIEYTPNPAWYAVQALPYLFEYPFECSEQTWNRYYANSLAAHILDRAPKIKEIFSRWQVKDTAALMSNLEKNGELKSALLEETPWVFAAKNETQQKHDIALLFDLARLSAQLESALNRLRDMQLPDGSFSWFPGGRGDRYITQYIASGMGHLERLGVNGAAFADMRRRAISYLDGQVAADYQHLLKSKSDLDKLQVSQMQVQYLYARSFTGEKPAAGEARTAFDYYIGQAARYWISFSKRTQGMTALALSRYDQKKVPAAILQSLRETAVRHEELGMYWKDNQFGYSWFWWYAPIETQALMIEAFTEAGKDQKTADELRTWLIKNKQTHNWYTTTATADACYALLLQGSDWINNSPRVTITAGPLKISSDTASEAGTGYFKRSVPAKLVRPEMGQVTVKVEAPVGSTGFNAPSWGAVYWQYFEDIDKVTAAATPLRVERRLFREVNKGRGPELVAIDASEPVHVGDKLRVRLVLRTDRPMEYVHLKDLRASCLEPVNVLSRYRWDGGLGYYENTRDISTNFFIDHLPRGTFVIEYPVFVSHKGQFSAGLATAQCMYAPEFSAHSEGQQLTIE